MSNKHVECVQLVQIGPIVSSQETVTHYQVTYKMGINLSSLQTVISTQEVVMWTATEKGI
jgi:hypothetical protein